MFRPQSPYTAVNEDTEVRVVGFDPAAFMRTASLLYGQHDLEVIFDGARPSTPASARTWLAAFTVAREYQQTGLLRNDLIRASVYRLLAVTAIEFSRLVGGRRALHASVERQRNMHRAATDFMHAFASLPITIDEAAEAAGASVPELVRACQAHTRRWGFTFRSRFATLFRAEYGIRPKSLFDR